MALQQFNDMAYIAMLRKSRGHLEMIAPRNPEGFEIKPFCITLPYYRNALANCSGHLRCCLN